MNSQLLHMSISGKGYITSSQITKIVNMFGTPASKDAIEKFMTVSYHY